MTHVDLGVKFLFYPLLPSCATQYAFTWEFSIDILYLNQTFKGIQVQCASSVMCCYILSVLGRLLLNCIILQITEYMVQNVFCNIFR